MGGLHDKFTGAKPINRDCKIGPKLLGKRRVKLPELGESGGILSHCFTEIYNIIHSRSSRRQKSSRRSRGQKKREAETYGFGFSRKIYRLE